MQHDNNFNNIFVAESFPRKTNDSSSQNRQDNGSQRSSKEGSNVKHNNNYSSDEERNNLMKSLTTDELNTFKEAFTVFDKNQDGTITTKELSTVMRSLGQNPTDAEVQDMINEVDVDGSGAIEFPEFCMMMVKKMHDNDTENEIREAFRVFDKEQTGTIDRSEMKHVLASLPERVSENEIEEMLMAADSECRNSNADGSLSYEQFKYMIGATINLK